MYDRLCTKVSIYPVRCPQGISALHILFHKVCIITSRLPATAVSLALSPSFRLRSSYALRAVLTGSRAHVVLFGIMLTPNNCILRHRLRFQRRCLSVPMMSSAPRNSELEHAPTSKESVSLSQMAVKIVLPFDGPEVRVHPARKYPLRAAL